MRVIDINSVYQTVYYIQKIKSSIVISFYSDKTLKNLPAFKVA